nr:hypothetical protein [Brucepastera parasyntrophica]
MARMIIVIILVKQAEGNSFCPVNNTELGELLFIFGSRPLSKSIPDVIHTAAFASSCICLGVGSYE